MSKEIFLIINLVVAFYNIGTIWAHEIDIFRSWKLLDPVTFHKVQTVHWRKLPYWIFVPAGLSLIGSFVLFWYHPDKISRWEIWIAFIFQISPHLLTAIFWGQWQAKLSKDKLGSKSRYLDKIIKSHWIRTALINAYGIALLYLTIQTLQ